MAEQDDSEKTEEPTEQKLREARKKGDVPKSQEIASLALLAAGLAFLVSMGGLVAQMLGDDLRGMLEHVHHIDVDGAGALSIGAAALRSMGLALAIPLAVFFIVAVLAHGLQSGFVISAEKMAPKFSKISPVDGAKRVFGLAAVANFGKGVAKLVAVGAAAGAALWPRREAMLALVDAPPLAILKFAQETAIILLAACLAVVALIAAADYAGQRMSWMKRQRMSRRDIKDEHKNNEGDPMVKARLRQIRAEKARQRMMTAVPDATVVIANPTHYAVALKYDEERAPAPICVAKGVDHLALKIREIAEQNDVPVVEEAPLARALYATVEVDHMIPETHFQAVAKIIGAILQMARRRGRRSGSGGP